MPETDVSQHFLLLLPTSHSPAHCSELIPPPKTGAQKQPSVLESRMEGDLTHCQDLSFGSLLGCKGLLSVMLALSHDAMKILIHMGEDLQ